MSWRKGGGRVTRWEPFTLQTASETRPAESEGNCSEWRWTGRRDGRSSVRWVWREWVTILATDQPARRTDGIREGAQGDGLKICRQGERLARRRETDGWRCGGGSRISTREELCCRSSLPDVCFRHADRGREEEPEKRASRSYVLQEWQGG